MNKKCATCGLVNFPTAVKCSRCEAELMISGDIAPTPGGRRGGFLVRAVVCLCVALVALFGFYLSLIATAKPISVEEKVLVRTATRVLREKGFLSEARLLGNFTVFRGNDNWLNASVAKENAYAATNFPFERVTLYPDFFSYRIDDIERAAILLHEAKHLAGQNEHDAYEYVWKNRDRLGWIRARYGTSPVWQNVRRQTKENVPELFTCEANDLGDCTE